MSFKVKKSKKSKRQRGNTTYGHGARKKWMGKGHHGGKGMAGSGKRADQKTTLVTKLYGNKYFGKQGITSKSTKKKKFNEINLKDIQRNIHKFKKVEINLKNYKVLGDGEIEEKVTIIARAFTNSAKEKIEKSGGKAVIFKKEKE